MTMKQWLCVSCWHEILSSDRQPLDMNWSDGHVCKFKSPADIRTENVLSYENFIGSLEKAGEGFVDLSDGDFPENELRAAYELEVKMMLKYAIQAQLPKVFLYPFRKAGDQFICEFEVRDLVKKDNPGQMNWHGQNTSQWIYAGCILYDKRDNRVSRHH